MNIKNDIEDIEKEISNFTNEVEQLNINDDYYEYTSKLQDCVKNICVDSNVGYLELISKNNSFILYDNSIETYYKYCSGIRNEYNM